MCSDLNHNTAAVERECGISLGSNLGDRPVQLMDAVRRIRALPGSVRVMALSSIYETEPVDVPAEYRDRSFYNAVVIVHTAMAPQALAESLHAIEAEMGRIRGGERNAPRVIDIDLLYAGECRIETAQLVIPHPRWSERRFVVEPLAEVRSGLTVTGEQRTVFELLQGLPRLPTARRVEWVGWNSLREEIR